MYSPLSTARFAHTQDGYGEYLGEQADIFECFQANLDAAHLTHLTTVLREQSGDALRRLEPRSFDLIYVDGNHEAEYVLEDAILAFRLLKPGGTIVFDDYGWAGETAKDAIDSWARIHGPNLVKLGEADTQVFFQRS